MDFKRLTSWIFGQGLLFACGAGGVLAVQGHLYASALVVFLLAVSIVALLILSRPTENRSLAALVPTNHLTPWRLVSSVLDQIPAPLVLLEPDGPMKAANREARQLFRTDDRIIDPPISLREAAAANGGEDRRTVSFQVNGEARTYAMSMIELASPGGVARFAMLLDIQAEIRTAEANTLRDLMQILSHEIMNALTPIVSLAETAVELLAEGTPASAQSAQGAVEILARRAEGLSRFVDAYRTLARLPSPILKPTQINELLDEVAQLFQGRWGRSGVRLTVTKPDPDIIANIDRDQMVHAVINILSNAADAALSCSEREARVELSVRKREHGVTLIVRDSGSSVAAEHRNKIFQPFFTTKAEGTGVGLSFARQVALSHGGDLVLAPTSEFGGAEFEMSF